MNWNFSTDTQFDTITNNHISLKVARLGAEAISLKIKSDDKWIGLLVNDDDLDPQHDYWKRHAPFLFPIVGGLQDDCSVTTDGKEIKLPSHGYARISEFKLVNNGSDDNSAWLEYELVYNKESIHTYPWDNTLTIKYILTDSELRTEVSITNNSLEKMWFQFGWHPGFMAPISGNASNRNNVTIELPEGKYTLKGVNSDCLLTNNDKSLSVDNPLVLSDKELEDTYILDMESIDNRWISLYDPKSKIKTTVSFNDYPHLGLWALPNAPYICIEPWQGCDDYEKKSAFDEKFGIISLESHQTDHRVITVTIEDKA